jgi:hypothetical protein
MAISEVTTHSPYVRYTINNLLMAGKLRERAESPMVPRSKRGRSASRVLAMMDVRATCSTERQDSSIPTNWTY